MKRIISILLLGALAFSICYSADSVAPIISEAKATEPDKTIRVSVNTTSNTWNVNEPVIVEVQIENMGVEKISFPCSVSLKINDEHESFSWWSPLGTKEGKARDKNDQREVMSIQGNDVISIQYELEDTYWGQSIQSVWPVKKVFDVVPHGEYSLYAELGIPLGTEEYKTYSYPAVKKIRSNSIKVTLE